MARRTRTAKTRAQRIDMDYFKRPHPFRRWRLVLSMLVPAVALLWVGGMAAAGSKKPYSSGPVSAAHAVFGQRCERCHVTKAATFRSHVTDQACLSCHDAPAHKANQAFTPPCATCHLDHRGPVRLAAVDDRFCEQCHQNLATTNGVRTVAAAVGPFSSSHPEFAARRSGSVDKAALRFNHSVHLKPDLRGPSGPTTLQCTMCHSPSEPIKRRGTQDIAGGLMTPVKYAKDCASCHPLYYDPLIDQQAPHDKPEIVHAMVIGSLRSFIEANPSQIGKPDPPRSRIPINFPGAFPTLARNAGEWVEMRTAFAERYLWTKTCAECHVVQQPAVQQPNLQRATALATVVPTAVPAVWMPHARFDHRPHRLAACETCHGAAATSRETSDVLLPSISTCQQCHKPDAGAESRCFECHEYHDWAKAKPPITSFDLRQLTN